MIQLLIFALLLYVNCSGSIIIQSRSISCYHARVFKIRPFMGCFAKAVKKSNNRQRADIEDTFEEIEDIPIPTILISNAPKPQKVRVTENSNPGAEQIKPLKVTKELISSAQKKRVEDLISIVSIENNVHISKINWLSGRLEVIVTDSLAEDAVVNLNAEQLQSFHKQLYEKLESTENSFLVEHEVIVASPGIGDFLKTDKDFETFNSFPVCVTTKEEFKGKTSFTGTLTKRTGDAVLISLKGRILEIPRCIIESVQIPKPQIEPTDSEMSKLR